MDITLLEFSAPWCSACKALAPTLATLSIPRRKIDTDADPETAAKYGVRALPTLIFLKNGQVAAQLVGNVPKSKLDSVLASLSAD